MLLTARASMVWTEGAASDVAQTELDDVIMRHSMCHTGNGLSQKVMIIEICVWSMCLQVLHALNGTKRSSGFQDEAL